MSIRIKLLSFYFLTMGFVLLVCLAFEVLFLNRETEKLFSLKSKEIIHQYHLKLDSEIKSLSIAADTILNSPKIVNLFIANDRDTLLREMEPLLQKYNEKYQITHIYFHHKNGKNFLRIHEPKLYGDSISRFTFKQAVKNSVGSGIELGKTAFALRYVTEIRRNNKLLGYLELGEEIDHLLVHLKQTFDTEFLSVVDKNLINVEAWSRVVLHDKKTVFNRVIGDQFITGVSSLESLDILNQKKESNGMFSMIRPIQFDIPTEDKAMSGVIIGLIDLSRPIKKLRSYLLLLFFGILTSIGIGIVVMQTAYKHFFLTSIHNITNKLNRIKNYIYEKNGDEISEKNEFYPIYNVLDELVDRIQQTEEQKNKALEEQYNAKVAADKASAAKTEFLANMSHELRTPLNSLLGMTEMLVETKLDETQKQYLKVFDKTGQQLLSLVNDILDLSKVEVGALVLENVAFDLEKLGLDVFKILDPSSANARVRLTYNCYLGENKYFFGDPVRIKQVLINLVGNALKFTTQGEVSIEISKFPGEPIRLLVSDTGIGIPKEKQKLIFERFSQVDSSVTRRYGGTGLGLNITSQLIEKMNGGISIESEEGKGARFSVLLPLQPAKKEDLLKKELNHVPSQTLVAGSQRAKVVHKQKFTILLVEDNEDNRNLIQIFLKKYPVQIIEAHDGKQAIDLVRQQYFDLILMDIQMPIMDGYEAIEVIRGIEKKECPNKKNIIVALSANAYPEHIQKAMDCGADLCLTKPISKSKLIAELQGYLDLQPSDGSKKKSA